MKRAAVRATFAVVFLISSASRSHGETGYEAWLRYPAIQVDSVRELYQDLPASVVTLGKSPEIDSGADEIIRGVLGMLGRVERRDHGPVEENAIVLGRLDIVRQTFSSVPVAPPLVDDGYWLKTIVIENHRVLLITAANDRGVLYGAFQLLKKMALHERIASLDASENPYQPIRWINQWDNLDGTIERGYAGRSIFFENGKVSRDLSRVRDYARLLSSIGINGCTVNNVNAPPQILSSEFLPQIARIADALRPWGVRLSLSVDFTSPKSLGGLATFDPLDPAVKRWWDAKADEIYRFIPDFAGFTLKADSEGRQGPSLYGRTHADAANLLAGALKKHGGMVMYRTFVYNHHADWHNRKNDRARAAYDNFHPLDGAFEDNTVLQIKYGPIDFQAREPVSPLIGGLTRTNELLELQITQEYTGQQRHLCYLVPMWKQVLDFHLGFGGPVDTVKKRVAGLLSHRKLGGLVGVANVGLDANWLGNDLAMANLFGFGRLAWNPDLDAVSITQEWTRMTFGHGASVVETVTNLELESWHVYEGYTGPMGLGTLTDILHSHYGPGIESAERNGWGQWIRADRQGIGMDRTTKTGTGYIGQYSPQVAQLFEALSTTPDNLLLFMHHVSYDYVLHSGETVVQAIYDSHYDAAAEAQRFPKWWEKLRGLIDEPRFARVLAQLDYQAGHAVVWRDAICTWFERESGIPDKKGRVGQFPERIEAESMQLSGYVEVDVSPPEDASGAKAVNCARSTEPCWADYVFRGQPGWYSLSVQYFDLNTGAARFRLLVNGQQIDAWTADKTLPGKSPNGDTSVRRSTPRFALRQRDVIRVEGTPDRGDTAAFDYLALDPNRAPDRDPRSDLPDLLNQSKAESVPGTRRPLPAPRD